MDDKRLLRQIKKASKAVSNANDQVGNLKAFLLVDKKSIPESIDNYHYILMSIKFELDYLELQMSHGKDCSCEMCIQTKKRAEDIKKMISE